MVKSVSKVTDAAANLAQDKSNSETKKSLTSAHTKISVAYQKLLEASSYNPLSYMQKGNSFLYVIIIIILITNKYKYFYFS